MEDMLGEWKDIITRIQARENRYHPNAYIFLAEALARSISVLPEERHIDASELVDGFIKLAFERFGYMAGIIVENWGIHDSSDIGSMVGQLIIEKVLLKREEDSIEDFKNLVDLVSILDDPRNYSIMS